MANTAFSFVPRAYRQDKPRQVGLTEIRGPYYSTYGRRHLEDVLQTAGQWVDGIKYAGGSFALFSAGVVRELNETAHGYDVYVSSGGFIETVLRYGLDAVDRYLAEARDLGFDVIEISAGFISLPSSGLLRLVERVQKTGLKAKPELGIQFGAGGSSTEAELAAEGTKDVGDLVGRARRALEAGADSIMIESEGITEGVATWNTAAVAEIANGVGLEHVMFEGPTRRSSSGT